MSEPKPWTPPFCAREDADLDCPKCDAKNSVFVRERDLYTDGDQVEAFCDECHVSLTVTACVDVAFADAELSDSGDAYVSRVQELLERFTCPDHPGAKGSPYADVVECNVCGRAMSTPEGQIVR